MKFLGAWTVLALCVAAQSGVPYYGVISGDQVRLRGGPGDAHAILGEFDKGSPVHALEKVGRWVRVEIPGGFPVYVTSALKEKDYVRHLEPGEAVILVDDLLVRPAPSGDLLPLGRLNTGDRVVVLDTVDGYTRILSPTGLKTFIFEDFVSPVDDQVLAEQEFAQRHRTSRRALLETGELSRQLLTREDRLFEIEEMSRAAFAAYEEQRQKAWDQRDTTAVRQALSQLRDDLPEGHPSRRRAEGLLVGLVEWERAGSELAAAKSRFGEAEREAAAAETRYAETLRELRTQRTREAAEPAVANPSPYMATGRVGRSFPVAERLVQGQRGAPAYELRLGDRRAFYLQSTRYDLSEYEGKLVGILAAEGPLERPGLASRIYTVTRIEILESEPGR